MQDYACFLCLEPEQHKQIIYSVRFSPDEKKLLTQSADGTAKLWDAHSGELMLTVPVYGSAECLCCFSPCGEFVLSTEAGGERITLHRASDGSIVAKAVATSGERSVRSGCFSADGVRLAVGFGEGGVKIFSVPDLTLLSSLPRQNDGTVVQSLTFTPDGAALLVATCRSVEAWDVAPGAEPTLRHTLSSQEAYRAAVSPDGKHAAAGTIDGRTEVWDLTSGASVLVISVEGDGASVVAVSWLPSGDALATCSDAGLVRFWSFSAADPPSSGQLLGSVDVFGGRWAGEVEIWDFCLSPSGSMFACGGGDDHRPFVKVFRAPTLSPLQQQLGELLRSKRGADVSLACGSAETPAHSLILALRSGTLQRQLDWGAERAGGAAAATVGASADRPLLEIDSSVEPAILDRLLEYLYTDHLVIQSAEEAQHLLNAAAFYDVPGLFQLCLAALEKRLAVENVTETFIAADKYGARAAGLKLAAMRFLKEHATDIVLTPGWQRVSRRLSDELIFFQASGKLASPQAIAEAGAAGGGDLEQDGAAAGGGAGGGGGGVGAGRNVRQRTA